MPESGEYHWRDGGEAHINDPTGIANPQDAVREKNQGAYDAYSRNANKQVKRVQSCGLLEFRYENPTAISNRSSPAFVDSSSALRHMGLSRWSHTLLLLSL